jgi:hypothetical protein
VVVNVTAASGSTITDRTSVSSATLDPNSANNETSATTTVVDPPPTSPIGGQGFGGQGWRRFR